MSRPEDQRYNRNAGIPYRRSDKIRIKKRWRPKSQRRTPDQVLEDWVTGFWTWLTCMFDLKCPVYREEFPAALWGEMGEYGVRFSTVWSILFIIFGIIGLVYLPGTHFLFKSKLIVFIAMIIIGLRQLADLNGPIWWADLYAIEQVNNCYDGKDVEHYERYSETVARMHSRNELLLTISEVRRLAELYHQYRTDTLSERSWRELGSYTKAQVEFFYQVVRLGADEERFPEDALKPTDPVSH